MAPPQSHSCTLGLVLAFVSILHSADLPAAEKQWLGGAEASSGVQYAFLGLVMPIGDSGLGRGLVQRYWIDQVSYRYSKDAIRFKADAPGVEGALGYQASGPSGWWGLYGGILYRDTRISPDDPESRSRGGKVRLKFQAEGERLLAQAWRLNGNVSYVTGQAAYWARARLLHGTALHAGPELVVHGDRDYRATHLGGVLIVMPDRHFSVGLKAGARQLRSEPTKPYVGVELLHVF